MTHATAGEVNVDIYKVRVTVNERQLECTVRSGILATIETGKHQDRVEQPIDRVAIMVGADSGRASAWVQVSNFDGEHFRVSSEGWISEDRDVQSMPARIKTVEGSIERASEADIISARTHEDAVFGRSRCCTSYGNGCYVKCCGGCCSDPTGCPGASCCP